MQVRSLGQEDPLEMKMATHPRILFFFSPQYSCLENPMYRGAWWATFHGIAESQSQLNVHTPCPLCFLEISN